MTGQGDEVERPGIGVRILKWLAPLSAGAVLGFLIMRASLQSDEPAREPPPPPPAIAAAAEPAPQVAEAPKPADSAPDAAVPSLRELGAPSSNRGNWGEGTLGGSKSGTLRPLELLAPAVEEPAP